MPKTLHFENIAGYHRWLAFGHIHNKFHGRANIMIHGKHHAVVHKTHHGAHEMHEYKEGNHRVIKLNLGRGIGVKMKTGKGNNLKKPTSFNTIWRGTDKGIMGGHGGMKLGKINIGKIHIRI
jgi:hypothetical protein